ncbi:hypothetical protein [Agromyces sp. NPDC058126]|uniref:hypothetical protein n=1 Tax=Agromyces sp. NPDC058126 TaxID=3346350 RepID=UPI0036DA270B
MNRPRRRRAWPTAVGLVVWVPLALGAMICLGIWMFETMFTFTYTVALAARANAMHWLWSGLGLSILVFAAGWVLSRRWWGALLAVTPAVIVAVGEIWGEPDDSMVPQLLFPVAALIAVVGIVFVVRQADAVMPPLDADG